jgi:hypothetical protein
LHSRRIGAALLVTVAATATGALAAETDSFRGTTEGSFFSHGEYRQARISFQRTGNTLRHIRFEIRVRCPSGQHRSQVGHIRTVKVRDGRFKFNGAVVGTPIDGGSGEFRRSEFIRGRIAGDHASGVVQLSTTLDGKGNEAGGGKTCRSGKVEWTAASL